MDADIGLLKSVCQQLNKQPYVATKPSLKSVTDEKPSEGKTKKTKPPKKQNDNKDSKDSKDNDSDSDSDEDDVPSFNRADLENLVNFIDIYTDVLEYDDVMRQFKDSNLTSLMEFEMLNCLHNVGFFYVKINDKCSPIEFLSLLDKVPLEQFCLPGTDQVSYAILNKLFEDFNHKIAIQLMVLGHSFGYFELINPYMKMKNTMSDTKLILSAMGSLSILIKRGYLRDCIGFVQNFDVLNQKQKKSGQAFLS